MLLAEIIATVTFVTLHAPGGQEIDINPNEVTSIREPRAGSELHFGKDIRCVVIMSNGRINAVVEECKAVIDMIEHAETPK